MARLRGTVALVLQKHFAASPEVPATDEEVLPVSEEGRLR